MCIRDRRVGIGIDCTFNSAYDSSVVVRCILDDIEQGISEVLVIEHAVTGSDRSTSVTEHVPGKTDTRSKIVPVLIEEVVRTLESSVAHLSEDCLRRIERRRTSRRIEVEVGIKRTFCIRTVQYAEVLPTHTQGQGEAAGESNRIFAIKRNLVVAIVASKVRRRKRAINGRIVDFSWHASLGVDCKEVSPIEYAVNHVLWICECPSSAFKCGENMVITQGGKAGAPFEGVPSLRQRKPSSARNRILRSTRSKAGELTEVWNVSGKNNWVAIRTTNQVWHLQARNRRIPGTVRVFRIGAHEIDPGFVDHVG